MNSTYRSKLAAFDGQKFLVFQFRIGQFAASVNPLHNEQIIWFLKKLFWLKYLKTNFYHADFNVAINKTGFNLRLHSEAIHQF